jgi:CcmD family protein
MTTFAIAFLIAWLAIVLYVARLALVQRRLAQELRALRDRSSAPTKSTRRAA